ncbi:sigma-70 family RNA polymerase sigma factor [Planctomicrobium sp. SH668]|uniref:sigma-70 family RNA polymerase sigma factor n=1 Tax=Planctomicrobium sp. SH668 TaxID=3448126 RepID=UPI003F5BCDBE
MGSGPNENFVLNDADHLWAEDLRADDPQVLGRLVSYYRLYLQGYAANLIPDGMQGRGDRSDLIQETLMRGYASRDKFRGSTNAELTAWLKQILHHVAVDWIRHHTAEKRDVNRQLKNESEAESESIFIDGAGESPSQNSMRREDVQRISEALTQLSNEQRTAVQLRSEGRTFLEMGIALNRSEDAARMLWGRGVERLLLILGDNDK